MNPSLALNSKIEADLIQVEELLQGGVRSQVYLANHLSQRLVQLGGKRLRPLLMCLSYHSISSSQHKPRVSASQLHTLASVGEWVHTATLFHDDVLDHSATRRGEASAHILEGNKVAILVGDFVYAEAFALLMEQGLMDPSKKLAHTIRSLVEGELLQYRQTLERDVDSTTYDRVAKAETASLFAWCCETGAWAAGSEKYLQAGNFGLQLGFAFQMADDLLDTFELNASDAKVEELKEWALSAPPLPIVTLGQNDPGIQKLWQELPAQIDDISSLRNSITLLQKASAQNHILEIMRKKIDTALSTACALLNDFGSSSEFLGQAVDVIRARAETAQQKALNFQGGNS